jgi:RHS repeat-associated protein
MLQRNKSNTLSQGKRAKKIITVGSTVTTYKYHWDGDLPVKIDKTVGETTTSTYFTFRKPGDILTMTVGESTYFYVQNIRGDVVALMDSSGNQVASYTYDTWGKPTISNPNNLPNPFLYQGSYATFYDDEFGMYGMGARHYNPITMRFISRDLNHGTLTNTMSQNLYIYCYNNPLGFKDPSGFSPVSCGVEGGLTGDTGMPYSTNKEDGSSTPIPNSGTEDERY